RGWGEEDRELRRVETLADHLGRRAPARLVTDHQRARGVVRGLEVILKEAANHRGRCRPLIGSLTDERAAGEGFRNCRAGALSVDLLFQLRVPVNGLGV